MVEQELFFNFIMFQVAMSEVGDGGWMQKLC